MSYNVALNWWMSASAAISSAFTGEKKEVYTQRVADQIVRDFEDDRSPDALRIAENRIYFLKKITQLGGDVPACFSTIARAEALIKCGRVATR